MHLRSTLAVRRLGVAVTALALGLGMSTPSSGARACLRACPQPFFTVLLPLAAALAGLSAPSPSYAQAAPATAAQSESARVYAIAPGPLNDALAAFARQAGISLGYSSSQLSGARSAGLNGQYGVADGLRALLAGTGYRAVNVDGGIRVEAEPQSATSTLACGASSAARLAPAIPAPITATS